MLFTMVEELYSNLTPRKRKVQLGEQYDGLQLQW